MSLRKIAPTIDPRQKARIQAALVRLAVITKDLERAKDLYREQDELTQFLVSQPKLPQIVKGKGWAYEISVKNLFEEKNVVWKSVATKQFQIEFRKLK